MLELFELLELRDAGEHSHRRDLLPESDLGEPATGKRLDCGDYVTSVAWPAIEEAPVEVIDLTKEAVSALQVRCESV